MDIIKLIHELALMASMCFCLYFMSYGVKKRVVGYYCVVLFVRTMTYSEPSIYLAIDIIFLGLFHGIYFILPE
jgi:hypothetical protein